jgi:5-methylcytosine-specific restriction protein B
MAQKPNGPDLQSALAEFDKASLQHHIEAAREERKHFEERFSLEAWPSMPLEAYALGVEKYRDTYCYLLEWGSLHLGSIRGGSAHKLLIYKTNKGPWYFDAEYKDEQEAWQSVRAAFVEAFRLAKSGDWGLIDDLPPLQGGPALRVKSLHVYFPKDILPIASRPHVEHFLRKFDRPEAENRQIGIVQLNRALLSTIRSIPSFQNWDTNEIERFLYSWAAPPEKRRVVKIAPGHDAIFWSQCFEGRYVCVGWDEVGDLRNFDTKESFVTRFSDAYSKEYGNNQSTVSRKANELWTLKELEPGDVVVANKGTSEVLAVGNVVEPGYEWMESRQEYKHIVHVDWDKSYAKQIPSQKKWAFATVAPVSVQLYGLITGKSPVTSPAPISDDLPFDEIAAALKRKGQVILYGPPGTGKTFIARQFAVFWLCQLAGKPELESILADAKLFEKTERELSTAQITRRVWWVVANPSQWSWDALFREKKVRYRYGRLQRNYPLVQVGDLVVGYQATPDKKIVALGRITEGFNPAGKNGVIEIGPVSEIKNGPTFDEMSQDATLRKSEPIRFNNQGTLFALTEAEASHLLALLSDKNANLQPYLDGETGISGLTRLTFHPSYSYEDFIEGFRPVETGDATISLRLEDGIFKRICRAAQAQPDKTFLLLIDEINRANLAKVFGEIITLLENDKRGLAITLPQSKESFFVPPNVYLLGTMNTADRSIKLLDAALRRRFAFIELMPDLEILRGAKIGALSLDVFLGELNRRIAEHDGREKQIGHAVLLDRGQPVSDQEEFVARFKEEILPLLQEYCYDDFAALARYLGPKLVNQQAHTLNADLLSDTDSLIATLEQEFAPGSESH